MGRKILYLLCVICFLAAGPSLFAQNFTSVSGTILDPNGIPYSNATISGNLTPAGAPYTLGGSPYAGTVQGSSDVNGVFNLNFGSNAAILSGGSQWLITVNERGILAPLGTGPQSFQITITISGASQNISAALNAAAPKLTNFASSSSGVTSFNALTGAVTISAGANITLTPAGNNIAIAATGGVPSVSSLPGTCTPGGTNGVVQLSVAPFGVYTCGGPLGIPNTYTASNCPQNAVCAQNFGVVGDEQFISDAVFTSGVNTVSSASGLFTASMVGKSCFGTNMTTDTSGFLSVVESPANCTVATFTDSNHITMSGTALANVNPGYFVWGTTTNQDTNLEAAWTVAQTNGLPLELPCGGVLVSSAHFITFNSASFGSVSSTDATRRGYRVKGCGSNETFLTPMPNFNFASCTGGGTGLACFFAAPSMWLQGLSIEGFGQSVCASANVSQALVEVMGNTNGNNSKWDDVMFKSWCGQTPSATTSFGVRVGKSGTNFVSGVLWNGFIIEGFGFQGVFFDPGLTSIQGQTSEISDCWFDGIGAGLTLNGGGVSLTNCGTVSNVVQNGATLLMDNDQITYPGTGGQALVYAVGAGSTVYINNTQLHSNVGGVPAIWSDTSSTIHIKGSLSVNSGLAANGAYTTGGTIYDDCGNTFSGFNAASTGTFVNCASEPSVGGLCNSAAAPAVCAISSRGAVTIAAAATTVVVNTKQVTAASVITLTFDSSLGTRLGVTCNATEPALYGVTARTAGTSFTITSTAPITNPACFSYSIIG